MPRDELLKKIVGKDALFCTLTDKIDAEVIERAGSNLKVIATMSVGYEHIDLNECKKRKIRVGYTPEVLTDAVADLTIALTLATTRRLIEGKYTIPIIQRFPFIFLFISVRQSTCSFRWLEIMGANVYVWTGY